MTRQCFMCKKTFPINMFYKLSTGDFYSYCNNCSSTVQKKRYFLEKSEVKKQGLLYINKEDNFIKISLRNIFNPSRMFPKPRGRYDRKGWIPEITLEEMYGELLLHIQLMKDKFPTTNGRLCRYCDQPWTTIRNGLGKGKIIKSNFSIDRFDTNKTYMKSNVIFCCIKCNSAKKDSTKKEWLKYLEIDKEIHEENKTR